MDKLKIFLANAKKHQFWICCGVMVLASLGCWWWACGDVKTLFDRRKSAIETDFKGVEVSNDAPNKDLIDKTNAQNEKLKKKVFNAWVTLYDNQKKNNPFPTDVLGEGFEKAFTKVQFSKDGKEELESRYLDIYGNHIKSKYISKLKQIVKAREEVENDEENGAGMAGAAASEKVLKGVVDWDAGDFGLLESHFDWRGRSPTTLEVVLAQEDIAVYKALLQVVKQVNKGATSQKDATIKQILALQIGRDARTGWEEARQAFPIGGDTAAANQPGMMSRGGATMGTAPGAVPGAMQGAAPGAADQGAAGAKTVDPALFNDRYIDDKGQPLPFDPQYPHAKHPFPEYKMMPVYLNFVMDQRAVPKLLVALANSSMPIEVRRVRIIKEAVGSFDTGGAAGGTPAMGRPMMPGGARPMGPGGPGMLRGGMMGPGSGRGVPGAMRPRAPNPAATGGDQQDTTGYKNVPVRICAVICIYNPPDREKLGIPEEKPAAGTNVPANGAPPAGGAPPGNATVPAAPPKNATPGK